MDRITRETPPSLWALRLNPGSLGKANPLQIAVELLEILGAPPASSTHGIIEVSVVGAAPMNAARTRLP